MAFRDIFQESGIGKTSQNAWSHRTDGAWPVDVDHRFGGVYIVPSTQRGWFPVVPLESTGPLERLLGPLFPSLGVLEAEGWVAFPIETTKRMQHLPPKSLNHSRAALLKRNVFCPQNTSNIKTKTIPADSTWLQKCSKRRQDETCEVVLRIARFPIGQVLRLGPGPVLGLPEGTPRA